MMKYISTRGNAQPIIAEEAILRGLAPDGGLYVPQSFPALSSRAALKELSYSALCAEVLSPFFSLISKAQLEEAAQKAYARFATVPPVKLVKRESFYVLELFYGPTLAFKDMALCLLPHLMTYAKQHLSSFSKHLLLTATSGDTGKAAMEGFADVEGFEVIVFYPKGGVSPLQERQMLTQASKNTTVIGLEGTFDDAQRGVKAMLKDAAFRAKLSRFGYDIASANSINLGRLLAQIVYYVFAALHTEEMTLRFCVPTGNFGNVLAAHWAGRMGVPIEELLVATNENDVLDVFFKTCHYNAGRELILTNSPSMDILVSSNLERLLFEKGGEKALRAAMHELEAHRKFIWEDIIDGFSSGRVAEEEVREEIVRMWREEAILLDPHSAVASALLHRRKEKGIVVATASPFKFPRFVLESLGETLGRNPIEDVELLSRKTRIPIPEAIAKLADAPITQNRVCTFGEMERTVWEVLRV
ncbi:MAG TPA: threonine synthase [Clostridiaceae bacterium]|nr:threonine synthase [Clostridiaceae bacterium]